MSIDPTHLGIVHYPAKVLRTRAEEITTVNDEVQQVARRMIELMHAEQGIGLAAPQVGLSWRMFIACVPAGEGRSDDDELPSSCTAPMVCINPVISDPEGPLEPYDEGCLSLPDITGEVRRPRMVTLSALDIEGQPFSIQGTGLLARCWQHELDHLDGILILDRMSQLSRLKNRAAIRDLEKAAGP